jgi:hypothetical protein
MPRFGKEALSKYIHTDCRRQLFLYLHPAYTTGLFASERQACDPPLPEPQPPRPGLVPITEEGKRWEAEKVADLAATFGGAHVVGSPHPHHSGQTRYTGLPLATALSQATPGRFLVEAQFDIGRAFQDSLGIADYGDLYNLLSLRARPLGRRFIACRPP